MIGIFNFIKAYEQAISRGYDLILLNDAETPVVKFADYNKLLYEQKKKQKEAKKNQNIQKTKEIVFGVNIAENDFNTKINHTNNFLNDNCKVKITIKMEKRIAASNPQFGFDLANKITTLYPPEYVIDKPKQVNNLIFLTLEKKK